MDTIITRFPPSPTGFLHVGGARTALFNWLYARHKKGRFILRIEDTDVERSTQASVDAILESLEWLGIDWDEGPYFQSRRLEIYKEHIQKLLDSGNAYYCTCSHEKLEDMRKIAMSTGNKPKYDGTCRDKGLQKSDSAVVRIKAPLTGTTIVHDVIKGDIVFQNTELDDFVICRSDGTPTYNLAVVIDDITMCINTIIRGDDHVNNTPKQIMLYNALGVPLPVFGHVPMVLGSDKTRLSKRHGAMSVTEYREMGYLPDAFINYIARIGWSYGDQEFFTREELIEKFSLENIGRSAGVFGVDKLLALNADHIKITPPEIITKHLAPFLNKLGFEVEEGPFIEGVIKTLNARSKTLKEMAESAVFYFKDTVSYDQDAASKFLISDSLKTLNMLVTLLESLKIFDEKSLEDIFLKAMEQTGLKLGKIAQPVRVALTGKTASPGIFEILNVLGKEKSLDRLRRAVSFIEEKGS
ncbi:MAG: glutamate--tRNA ligase [Proteobacteria bacterium]|nr:glutamate--tRNA ligase [Pseudomonadota bacterium]